MTKLEQLLNLDRIIQLAPQDHLIAEQNSIKKEIEQMEESHNVNETYRKYLEEENTELKIRLQIQSGLADSSQENQRTQEDIENEKIVKNMQELFERAIDTYNNPDIDEENKRWGFYTATALQALLENKK